MLGVDPLVFQGNSEYLHAANIFSGYLVGYNETGRDRVRDAIESVLLCFVVDTLVKL